MNIVLIGYRGTGKSSVAGELARRLGREAVSLDGEIIRMAGRSIPEIVGRDGWEHFRNLETEAVRAAARRDNLVVDCGGGVVLREENVRLLRDRGFVVLLLSDKDTIAKRIGGATDRPSLTGKKSFLEEIEEIMAERMPRYRAAADFQIDTAGLSLSEVVNRISAELKNRKLPDE